MRDRTDLIQEARDELRATQELRFKNRAKGLLMEIREMQARIKTRREELANLKVEDFASPREGEGY